MLIGSKTAIQKGEGERKTEQGIIKTETLLMPEINEIQLKFQEREGNVARDTAELLTKGHSRNQRKLVLKEGGGLW